MGGGVKNDGEKPKFDLIPPRAMLEVARVVTHGAASYGIGDWRFVKHLRPRYLAAVLRHVNAYQRGEQLDRETGLHHLAHAAISLLFIVEKDIVP